MIEYGDSIMEPKVISNTRWVKKRSKFVEQSLIKWEKLLVDDATWENSQEIKKKKKVFSIM